MPAQIRITPMSDSSEHGGAGLALCEPCDRGLRATAVPSGGPGCVARVLPTPRETTLILSDPARQAALDAAGALDPVGSETMDRLARLAAGMLDAPTGLVSFVLGDCQILSGCAGVPDDVAANRAMPLSHSFCQYVVAGDAPLVVSDARTHPLLATNGCVTELGVVAYLGVPVRAANGHVLGSLCVVEDAPRTWTEGDVALLADLAASVETEVRFRAEARRHAHTARAFQAHAAEHRALLESLPLIVYQATPKPPYVPVYVSRNIEALGYTRDEWMAAPDLWVRLIHPDDRERVLRETEAALAAGTGVTYDYRMVARDGTVRWMHDRGAVIRDTAGRPAVWQGVLLDRTAQHLAEEALRDSEAQLSLIYHHTSNLLFLVEVAPGVPLDGGAFRCVSVNQPYLAMTGLAEDAVIGRLVADLLPPETAAFVLDRYRAAVAAGEPIRYEASHVLPRGRVVLETTLIPIVDDAGRCTHLVGVATDVTDRQDTEAELWRQAHHDALTGLANRTLFRERVTRALARTAGASAPPAAVLVLDLDDFKDVNDSLGHAVGDALLVAAAERLTQATRGCDTVARLGGDEFAVLLPDVGPERDVLLVADRVTQAFAAPFCIGAAGAGDAGSEVYLGASVGVARAHVGDDADALLRNADLAMYHAKARGKGQHAQFAPEMHATAAERLALAADLRHAVARGELRLQFQPIVDLATGAMCGAEALLRWHHPQRGLVSPAEFIPVAEATGSIVGLGRWVLAAACREAASWPAHEGVPEGAHGGAHGGAPYVSVNLSGRQLDDAGLVDDVVAALEASGLDPRALLLEITETALMRDAEGALGTLRALKALGVRLAVDDFGTGYSSLAYLQRFPVDVLKLDRAFVRGVAGGAADAALARAVVALGAALGLATVAEGIETAAQWEQLRALGCGLGQGFLFARPLDAAAVAGWRGPTR